MKQKIITIDGSSGSGKGTLARALAVRLGYDYLDSGALYRAVAYYFAANNLDCADLTVVEAALQKINFTTEFSNGEYHIFLSGREISSEIRQENCANLASKLAKLQQVRAKLLEVQHQAYDEGKGLVCDGRDMGSVVFPEAGFKVFLQSKVEVRANRRFLELKNNAAEVNYQEVLENLRKRDYNDEARESSPLVCPEGAFILDNSDMDVEQSVLLILEKLKV